MNFNKELINRANENSLTGKRGDSIVSDAEIDLKRFDETFQNADGWSDEQNDLLNKRRTAYIGLLNKYYGELLSRNANHVPWCVAGPSNYNVKKSDKQVDGIRRTMVEMEEKISRFIENTQKMIKKLEPPEKAIERISKGKWVYGQAIASDDPYVLEKLYAKKEFQERYQEKMKAANKEARKKGEVPPYPAFELSNNRQNLKATKDRIAKIEKMRQADYSEIPFEGGVIVPDINDCRVKIIFDEKPEVKVRGLLKKNAFHWSTKNKAWQRQLTANALAVAEQILTRKN